MWLIAVVGRCVVGCEQCSLHAGSELFQNVYNFVGLKLRTSGISKGLGMLTLTVEHNYICF